MIIKKIGISLIILLYVATNICLAEEVDINFKPEDLIIDGDKKIDEAFEKENEEFEVGEPDEPGDEKKNLGDKQNNKQEISGNKQNEDLYFGEVVLQGLNKITARTSLLNIKIGQPSKFGNLEIIPKLCWKSPQEERPENKVLLEIWEQKPQEEKTRVFYGWMFSSSPAISALEHPVYDVTVLECKEKSQHDSLKKQ